MGISATTGLISGIKFDDLINNVISLEKRPIDLLAQKKKDIQTKTAELTNLSIQLGGLKGKATSLAAIPTHTFSA